MAEPVPTKQATPDSKDYPGPKRGEKVEGSVNIPTKSRHLSNTHDEDAEKEFRSQFKGVELTDVHQVSKSHTIGYGIDYGFEGTVK